MGLVRGRKEEVEALLALRGKLPHLPRSHLEQAVDVRLVAQESLVVTAPGRFTRGSRAQSHQHYRSCYVCIAGRDPHSTQELDDPVT